MKIYQTSFKNIMTNLGVIIISLIMTAALAELGLRWFAPGVTFGSARELPWMHNEKLNRVFTIEPGFGFRPVLGNCIYNQYGTLQNQYKLKKDSNKIRLLFMGDSVTSRGRIIAALRKIYGEEKFEYWNAGVESFNTIQETAFYKKYNYKIKPDQVILSFHPNDFETTPIVFCDQNNRLVVYMPKQPLREVSPWLFKNSFLYRFFLCFGQNRSAGRKEIIQEVHKALTDLKTCLARDKIAFTVLVLPWIKPYSQWNREEKAGRGVIIHILQAEHIRYFDLSTVLENAWRQELTLQERPGAIEHPNDQAGAILATYLAQHHLFNEESCFCGKSLDQDSLSTPATP